MRSGDRPGLQNRRAASTMSPVCSTHTRFRQFSTTCRPHIPLSHTVDGQPCHFRSSLGHFIGNNVAIGVRAVEIEAESTAFLVTTRLGLVGSSAAYVSRYLDGRPLPSSVSLDQVAKVASRIEQMTNVKLRPRDGWGDGDATGL